MRYTLDWESVKQDIITGYQAGMTLRELACKHGVTHVTICKRLALWKISRRGTRHGGRKRLKDSPRPVRPGNVFKGVRVIEKDPVSYPLRWFCLCTCGSIHGLTERQLRRGNFRHKR